MGIILSILGIVGLVAAFLILTGFESSDHVSVLLICGVLAAVVFFTGIRLLPDGSAGPGPKKKEAGI